MRAINRLADGLLALVVPHTSAAAQECWWDSFCGTSCSAPYVRWRFNTYCCRGMFGISCSTQSITCACYG